MIGWTHTEAMMSGRFCTTGEYFPDDTTEFPVASSGGTGQPGGFQIYDLLMPQVPIEQGQGKNRWCECSRISCQRRGPAVQGTSGPVSSCRAHRSWTLLLHGPDNLHMKGTNSGPDDTGGIPPRLSFERRHVAAAAGGAGLTQNPDTQLPWFWWTSAERTQA